MTGERVTHVFTVRGRPVGFEPQRWGGALVAVERGYFPVSSTGYRSLCGLAGGKEFGPEAVSGEFLESLSLEQDRERESLLRRLREAAAPMADGVSTFVHVSLAAEKAVQDGFFATDRDRAALWAGAHRLLRLVETDARFRPAPDSSRPIWTKEHCDASMDRVRELLAVLRCCAGGEMPKELPENLIGARVYLELPPKPSGEPVFPLDSRPAETPIGMHTPAQSHQMSLFGSVTPEPAHPSLRRRRGVSPTL